MNLRHRINMLERRRPPVAAMPETITLFRGRDDIKLIRLGPDGRREERLIWSEPEEVR